MDRTQCPAYLVLRPSTKRLLMLIETALARNGDNPVMLYADQFDVVASRRIIVPGLSELCGLGFIDWQRFPKCHQISLSERWRNITSAKQAMIVSATARVQRMPMRPLPSQPASVSA